MNPQAFLMYLPNGQVFLVKGLVHLFTKHDRWTNAKHIFHTTPPHPSLSSDDYLLLPTVADVTAVQPFEILAPHPLFPGQLRGVSFVCMVTCRRWWMHAYHCELYNTTPPDHYNGRCGHQKIINESGETGTQECEEGRVLRVHFFKKKWINPLR